MLDDLQRTVMSVSAIRSVDQRAIEGFHMHSLVLMENAGAGCARWLTAKFATPRRTLILCGPGNNGGDGLVIARHLLAIGWDCRVVIVGQPDHLSNDASSNLAILRGRDRELVQFGVEPGDSTIDQFDSEVIIDALLGTGAVGAPRSPMANWIQWANRREGYRVAIDIPTGVDAQRGAQQHEAFAAATTLTFVALKPAMIAEQATEVFGQIVVLPIGIPRELIAQILEEIER